MESNEKLKKDIRVIYDALCEKGYDPVKQLAGYILSEDPVYITDWNGARSMISHINRDDLLHEIIREYFEENGDNNK